MKIVIAVLCIISLVACKPRSLNEPYTNAEVTNENRVTDTVEGEALISYKNDPLTAEFNAFLKKFSRDSLYQMAHVKFPFKVTHAGYAGDADSTFTWQRSEHVCINFTDLGTDGNGHKLVAETLFKDKNHAVVTLQAEETGINIEYLFIRRGDEWILTEMIDSST